MRRRRPRIGLALLGLVVLIGGGFLWWQSWMGTAMATAADPSDTTQIAFTIDLGESAGTIAARLEARELIRSGFAFTWAVSKRGLDRSFQQGSYRLSRSMTGEEVLHVLTAGTSIARVTLPEGLTMREIAQKLGDAGVADPFALRECFATCAFPSSALAARPEGATLEGYLFPDTYEFRMGSSARDVAEKLVSTFDARLTPELRAEIETQGKTIHEIVIVASMIEEEVRDAADRRMVSGIIWKRLAEGIPLGIDATSIYGRGEHTDALTAEDLASNSPYNTRLHKGLPPGPIANPGLDALDAAVHPKESDALFYLTDPSGVTHYARTNAEHEANKERYLR